MFEWFWNIFYSLGFFKKDATVLLLGLDNAGKTTLLHKLKHGSVHHFTPTQRAQLEEIVLGRVKFKTWDLGGHLQVRSFWKEYFVDVDAIVFVLDAADRERIDEARAELHGLLNDENLQDTTFLILANKIDLDDSYSKDDVLFNLQISSEHLRTSTTEGQRSMNVFMCSFVKNLGVREAFQWLSDTI